MTRQHFRVVIEPDEDFEGSSSGWRAFCPALERQGASMWGATQAEALNNIDEVLDLVLESMLEHGGAFPDEVSK
jgi:predicted RNase H-like HicB family nuclease